MISDFGFQEHIELLKLDVLLGTDFCQTRTTLRHFVAKNNYGSSYYSCGIQYNYKSTRTQHTRKKSQVPDVDFLGSDIKIVLCNYSPII